MAVGAGFTAADCGSCAVGCLVVSAGMLCVALPVFGSRGLGVLVCICVHGWRCVLRFVCSEVPGVCALVCRVLHVLCWFGVC